MVSQSFEKRRQAVEAKLADIEIEPGIYPAVMAVHLLGWDTFMSCEGHIDWGWSGMPWVDVIPYAKPMYEYEGEEIFEAQALEKIGAVKADISPGTIKDDIFEAYSKHFHAWLVEIQYKPSLEQLKWNEANTGLQWMLYGLILEFEQGRTGSGCRIHVTPRGRVSARDAFSVKYEFDGPDFTNELYKTETAKRLPERQRVMQEFSNFLIEKAKGQ